MIQSGFSPGSVVLKGSGSLMFTCPTSAPHLPILTLLICGKLEANVALQLLLTESHWNDAPRGAVGAVAAGAGQLQNPAFWKPQVLNSEKYSEKYSVLVRSVFTKKKLQLSENVSRPVGLLPFSSFTCFGKPKVLEKTESWRSSFPEETNTVRSVRPQAKTSSPYCRSPTKFSSSCVSWLTFSSTLAKLAYCSGIVQGI